MVGHARPPAGRAFLSMVGVNETVNVAIMA